jgi:hypothetical protein
MVSKHDKIAQRLADKYDVEYNEGKGPDIKTPNKVIEVATPDSDMQDSKRQLQGFTKPRYLAVPSDKIGVAKEKVEGTGIGVMGPTGKIHKKAH